MAKSIMQEGQLLLENAEEFKNRLSRAKEMFIELETGSREFYDMVQDRSNVKTQLKEIEGLLDEVQSLIVVHISEVEALLE